jgi:hypothetical protein
MKTTIVAKVNKALLIALTMLLLAAPAISRADDDICPTVYPCDENGELLAIFEDIGGFCGKKFALICRDVRLSFRKDCSNQSEQYNLLLKNHTKALSSIRKLKLATKKKS